jgi:gamma-glutamylcyclotransferase (GGCT)/AIG2-like uncharacterized protein YtfP
VFVYGTLMRGYPLHRLLAHRATFLGEGTYPGLVDTPDASHPLHATLGKSRPRGTRYSNIRARRTRYSVRGELYRLHDRELLHALDREEGYNFERCRAGVTLADGRRSRAWVYRYRGGRHRGVLIPYGDYRRAHPAR